MIKFGIDVGSTTVKGVVLNEDNTIIWKSYKRHNTRQPESVRELINDVQRAFPNEDLSLFITGSGGRSLAPHINASYIQEVNAVTYAVETLCPGTGSVIELGGQDAKIIIYRINEKSGENSTLTFMNDKCAGGTGSTLDKILGKIGISADEATQITATGKTIHHIAAKCGVFAETDVVGLVKAGVDKEEIFVSLCAAIVRQNLEVLVRGNVLHDRIVLLGGPNTFFPAFAELWQVYISESWKIHEFDPSEKDLKKSIIVPDNAQYFAAAGAVLFGRRSEELLMVMHRSEKIEQHYYPGPDKLNAYISEGRVAQLEGSGAVRSGLINSDEELDRFAKEYEIPDFSKPALLEGTTIPVWIGIDGGSTSTKLAIINASQELIYKDYLLSKGNPIEDVKGLFARIKIWADKNNITLDIKGTSVTGYASAILKEAFNLDLTVVETVAHMRSSTHFYGEIDIICDVGGQDIKVLFMKHGRVVDFKLNTQCSAGNGYFLQGMAEQFSIPVEQYATHAFMARKAPAFNYGCAVFMEQDRVNFQQLGWTKEEIMAGLALVLPLNIWNYVVQEVNLSRFGNRFILQGGTQKNLAAVKAQVDYIKSKVANANVVVHKYADICGAIGAALEQFIHSDHLSATSFIGIENAMNIQFETINNESTRCRFCNNRCARTFIDITSANGRNVRFITGYGCEKGTVDTVDKMKSIESRRKETAVAYPNLVKHASKTVFAEYGFERLPSGGADINRKSFYPSDKLHRIKKFSTQGFIRSSSEAIEKRADMVVGMPRLLNMYYYGPFYSTYLRTLGIKQVVWSDYTSSNLWNEGNKWGAIDPCFPAKVAPAHIYNLLQKGNCTHICFPLITHLDSTVDKTLANNACVIQMGTPEVVHAVFTKEKDFFKDHKVEYLKPLVAMDKPLEACGMLYEYFKEHLGITEDENAWAFNQAKKAMESYLGDLQERGAQIINSLIETDKLGLLLIGHPYHHDPGLNHSIIEALQMCGYPILCIESLPTSQEFLKPLFGDEFKEVCDKEFDIRDVWQRNFNRNTNLKFWAARIAARHPNFAVVDLSSFKCGHDAPTYSYIDAILDASETPHFLFHDIDQNRPGATFGIRIQTIDYFLKIEEEKLQRRKK
jgi:predicted CoA-substrate-specific enzyme activase